MDPSCQNSYPCIYINNPNIWPELTPSAYKTKSEQYYMNFMCDVAHRPSPCLMNYSHELLHA